MKERFRFLFQLFKKTGERWSEVEGYRLGASFSYYATFSIFPLLLLAVTVVGFVIGDDAPARERLLGAVGGAGAPVREVLDKTLSVMQEHSASRGTSAAVALFGLLFSASGAFIELDTTLNRIWCVPNRKSEGILGTIKTFLLERLSGFVIVGGIGLTLLASLASSSILSAIAERAPTSGPWLPAIFRTAEITASIALLAGVFTAAFHLIPRSRPPVRDFVGGAVLTTVMLMLLKEVFATYLAKLTSYSAYGLVGGFLALATWIYLSSQIIFFGAQLTRVHAEMLGSAGDCNSERRAARGRRAASRRAAHA
jgi:membrane protein